ncbi:RHS repeat domain-containing protein [Pseudomonas sp. P1.31]|uniref:RHS repeat domain-containing protein n=1 Tax=Pseudomonas sp. P1.31 TaxID=1699311 RepID=UPI000A400170|nr:RHS repeat protein [Pseudomonas sp. P1.31]
MDSQQWTDTHTPALSVVDSRGLAVRSVAYCRHPKNPSIEPRITRNHFDAAGRQIASWDPRLWGGAAKPNLATTYNLQNQSLLVDSVDAGWQLSLVDQAGMARSFWDGRGSQRHTEYDHLQRPTIVSEHLAQDSPKVCDRFDYGDGSDAFAEHNQCGQLLQHDHPAGSRSLDEYGVSGLLLSEQTRFLRDLELPDWSCESVSALLEDEVFKSTQKYGPLAEVRCQTDAAGNVRFFEFDRAGQLSAARLKLAGSSEPPRLLVNDIHYDATGNRISEQTGNDAVSTAHYAIEDGRLLQMQSPNGEGGVLQDFNYEYDPVGNIVTLQDLAQPTRYFKNQRIDPVNRYVHDSLYQLVEATGSEVSQPSHGPALPGWQTTPLDPNQLRNYVQAFDYDAAGNLKRRHHSDAETFEMFTSLQSNRSVADQASLTDGFDANGNQLELLRGQRMTWDVRNQLSRVTMVNRPDGSDDAEHYCYERPGHRLRKVGVTQAASRTLRTEVRYLSGLEIHRDTATGEERHVISVEAGHSQVRALHWETGKPADVRNDQLRFSLSNHLNSCTLELDEWGSVLSREVYYAYGGTALWAGASEVQAKYKTIRYSGKERDLTGLYYYGYRYYAPWLQRWVSTDPAGDVNGLNLFLFCGNGSASRVDSQGLSWNASEYFYKVRPIGFVYKEEGEWWDKARSKVDFSLDKAISEIESVNAAMLSNKESGFNSAVSDCIDNTFGPGVDRTYLMEALGRIEDHLNNYSIDRDNILLVERPNIKRAIGESRGNERLYAGVRMPPKDPMNRMVVTERELLSEGTLDIAFIHAAAVRMGGHELLGFSRGFPMIAPDATAFVGEDLANGKFDGEIVSRVLDRLKPADVKCFFGSKRLFNLEGKMAANPEIRADLLTHDAGVLTYFTKTLAHVLEEQRPPPYSEQLRNKFSANYRSPKDA